MENIKVYRIPLNVSGIGFYKNFKNYIHNKNMFTFCLFGLCLQIRTNIKKQNI